jgi:hypothetical protein
MDLFVSFAYNKELIANLCDFAFIPRFYWCLTNSVLLSSVDSMWL